MLPVTNVCEYKDDTTGIKMGLSGFAKAKYRDNGSLTGGGCCAVLVNARNWLSNQLEDIIVPQGLEVVWVKVAPKNNNCQLKLLVVCSIYSKPNSHKKSILS